MNPWLYWSESFALPTYFTLLMVGFALATAVLRREALRDDLPVRQVMNAALLAVPAALIGARLAHVLFTAPGYFAAHPMRVLSPTEGWVFYGGAIGGVVAVVAWARAVDLEPWSMLDVFAVATPFGLVFGRTGCLGGGCCYGRPADWPLGEAVPWAVTYWQRGQLPDPLLGVPLHPAPLYAVALALALFVGLSWLRSRQRFSGQIALAFLVFYGAGRAILELFRADVERGIWLGGLASTSQIIGLGSAAVALAWWRVREARCTPSS